MVISWSRSTTKSPSPADAGDADRPEAETVLRLSGITKSFGPLVANDAISLSLKRGEVVALLGENGAGKTTLMNILFGHYTADEGEIEAFGKTLPPGDPHAALAAGIGMVHQHFTLADQMTVLENIVLGTQPMWSFNLGKAAARAKIPASWRTYGLEVDPDRMISRPCRLANAAGRDPQGALSRSADSHSRRADSGADADGNRGAVCHAQQAGGGGISVIFISHKLGEVQSVADRVVVLRGGKLAGERKTSEATRRELAELMVGGQLPVNEIGPPNPRQSAFSNSSVFRHAKRWRSGAQECLDAIAGRRDYRACGDFRQWPGGTGGAHRRHAGSRRATSSSTGKRPADGRRVRALDNGLGRIPEDRHATGMIGDMSVAENVISEAYRSPRFSRLGISGLEGRGQFRGRHHQGL
jgi:ABC-type uncharacterized transport system ATPase subunit